MAELPCDPSSRLLEHDRHELTELTREWLAQLDQVSQELIRAMVGDEVYYEAETLQRLAGEDDNIQVSDNVRLQLIELNRKEDLALVKNLLFGDPISSEEKRLSDLLEALREKVFPDDYTLSLFSQPEKLLVLARILRDLRTDENRAIKIKSIAEEHINNIVTGLYRLMRNFNEEYMFKLIIDEYCFDLSFLRVKPITDDAQPRNIVISLSSGELTFNQMPVTISAQKAAIEEALQPLSRIESLLRGSLGETIVQEFDVEV